MFNENYVNFYNNIRINFNQNFIQKLNVLKLR